MFKIKETKSQGCCYWDKCKLVNIHNKLNNVGEIFLREYKYFYSYNNSNNETVLNEFAIWLDELNITHIRSADIHQVMILGTDQMDTHKF